MIQRFPIINTDLPLQREIMAIIKKAQAERNSILGERRVLEALTRNIPPAADRTYKLGEEVLVYSEKDKKWEGPFIVLDFTGRQVTVSTKDGTRRQMYSAFQIKPYYKEFQENLQFFNSKTKEDYPTYSVNITEVIEPRDPRAKKF